MTLDEQFVLQALYELEAPQLEAARFDIWSSPQDVANALPSGSPHRGDADWARSVLESLWVQRKVLQVPTSEGEHELVNAELRGPASFGAADMSIPVERNDVRGDDGNQWERVALFPRQHPTQYRSRVAEIARLLGWNYQRFRMLPSTGLLRYERRPQKRPEYSVDLRSLATRLASEIGRGVITYDQARSLPIHPAANRSHLANSVEAVLLALAEMFAERGQPQCIAPFQEQSILATLCGLHCPQFRSEVDGHVVTAGVGSGKSFAFQIGALIHVAYHALAGSTHIRVLLLYPRVVLAANQFQDLQTLLKRVEAKLGVPIGAPILDAGGQLSKLASAGGAPVKGALFQAIRDAYQGKAPILISNLDTLSNRLAHPEASEGLTSHLDLVVFDEVHLLSGLYGAHARMLLRRILLLRAAWLRRRAAPGEPFGVVLAKAASVQAPYLVGASATIAQPCQHFARLTSGEPDRFEHIAVESPEHTGWIHNIFLRQRPEASSMTAAINAVSCVIHNRRDGLHHEYYQASADGSAVSLDGLSNPVQPGAVLPRAPQHIHKTLGFCDSLDGVGRWADLVLDNEHTKAAAMNSSANPALGSVPYFARFQEPLWRVVHHLTFADKTPQWQKALFGQYGSLCRKCKQGVRASVDRVPGGLSQVQQEAVARLWEFRPDNTACYLARLGVEEEHYGNALYEPVHQMAQATRLENLERCGFFEAGLCWWWSRDHLGNNHPEPADGAHPLAGFKKPSQHAAGKYIPLNGIRVRSFTSKVEFEPGGSINDLFRAPPKRLFRSAEFGDKPEENCSFVIGSPRIEVGVDLARVTDGVTFRAMRDPASLQQKVGRVGREKHSDSVVVHIVTDNARDHFYLRNPRIALDPDYLQPIPLHEGNQVVCRNHYYMALFDFLVLQGANTATERISDDGDRIALINDHKYQDSFSRWDRKVAAVHDYLFGAAPSAALNRKAAAEYLRLLGATGSEVECPGHQANTSASNSPTVVPAGALDILRHEFGPNFLLTPIQWQGKSFNLAQVCATKFKGPAIGVLAVLPRHSEFLKALPQDDALQKRSYMYQVLTLPLFRRGLPLLKLQGDQPYLWTPNFFEAVGKEYVRVIDKGPTWEKELAYETFGLALSLLPPGAVSYRYLDSAQKVPVSTGGAAGAFIEQPKVAGVRLDTTNADYFEPANCPDLQEGDLPPEFGFEGIAVPVVSQRQVALVRSNSEPLVTQDGMLADGDESPANTPGSFAIATPPRCFSLRWYRIMDSDRGPSPVPCRLQRAFKGPGGESLAALDLPPVAQLFRSITVDERMKVTEFVWGLDRHFMTRQVEAARLIYRDNDPGNRRVALGHEFETTALKLALDLSEAAPIGKFLGELLSQVTSAAHQVLLDHALHEFLSRHATNPIPAGAPVWLRPGKPSVFVVRALRSLVWFHLLERWHPEVAGGGLPSNPPVVTLKDVAGCFTPGHANFIDDARFDQVCRWMAAIQQPTDPDGRADTLLGHLENFHAAVGSYAQFDSAHLRTVATSLLLNGLGLTLHTAALRVTGAESSDLSYFYRVEDTEASVYLFDSDEFGNGTVDLIVRNFSVSPVERLLTSRMKAIGGRADSLPTIDFLDALEEALQECESSHAAHVAFHGLPTASPTWSGLEASRVGERKVAGAAFDFIRTRMACGSFDHVLPFHACPEFLAHASTYACHASPLVPSPAYPTFQSLESAMGFCFDGCVSCLVAPEQNLHGPLAAKESVSKIILDAFYRSQVCERGDDVANAMYPGGGPGRTVEHSDLATCVSTSMAQSPGGFQPFQVELRAGGKVVTVTVVRATRPGPWARVLRPTWGPAPVPEGRVRPRMPL